MTIKSSTKLLAALLLTFAIPAQSQICTDQSCTLASLSGSSGEPYTTKSKLQFPLKQACCIIHYNRDAAAALYDQRPALKAQCKGTGNNVEQPYPPDLSDVQCKPKVLIFASGTSEVTTGGGGLGILLQQQLGSEWFVQGVNYEDDIPGYLCLGLPGGVTGTNMLAAYAKQCPDSALFVGGYSQGAQVAHNTVANSEEAVVERINAVLTFGDPFNGAQIKGYDGPIHTICNPGDIICYGQPNVLPKHLEYQLRIPEAAAWLNSIDAVSGGDDPSTITATATRLPASSALIASFSKVLSTAVVAAQATAHVGGVAAAKAAEAAASSIIANNESPEATSSGLAAASSASVAASSAAKMSSAVAAGNDGSRSIEVGLNGILALGVLAVIPALGMML